MKNNLDINGVIKVFDKIALIMAQESAHLCEMDALLGDGDLGLTMKRGFEAMPKLISEQTEVKEIGKRLAKAAMSMSSIAPSTMGTLMSSGIMNGGMNISSLTELDANGFASFLQGFVDGIIKRGKCNRGDCTILDSMGAANDKVIMYMNNNKDYKLVDVVNAAYEGSCEGLEATKSMIPRFGKALVQRDKASGVVDQGAYCGMLFLKGFKETVEE